MFETGERADGGTMLDEPELTEADYEAMVATQIAADPEPWPELSAEELQARTAMVIAQASLDRSRRSWSPSSTTSTRQR